jgi:hypothetical protein
MYTYHSSFVVVPFLIFLGWYIGRQSWKHLVMHGAISALVLSPLLGSLFQSGWTRAHQAISLPQTPAAFVSRIAAHFSPQFWLAGEQLNYRQSIPHAFVTLLPELLLFVSGFAVLFATRSPMRWQLLAWFVVALMPSFIGVPSPHTIRAFYVAPVVVLVAAIGFDWWLQIRHIWTVWVFGWGVYWILGAWFYTHQYRTLAATDYGYGYDQVMAELKKDSTTNSTFVISPFLEQPYLYTLLYWRITPAEFRAGGLANVTFRPIHWPEQAGSMIYAGSANEIDPRDPRVLKVISYPLTQIPLWVIAR